MRKLYNEFFYIPKHGKVREKVMLTRAVTTVAIVIVCLAAMSVTAYAYFSYNITSGSNTIKGATFKTEVQITDEDGEAVEVTTDDQQSHTAKLKAGTEYCITLKHTDLSTAKTGYIIITAEDCDNRYHTQQLGKDDDGKPETITFWLEPSADTIVTFFSYWGTSSYYADYMETGEQSKLYILKNDKVAIPINGELSDEPPAGNTGSTEGTTETTSTVESTTPAQTTAPSTAPSTETTTSAVTTTTATTGTVGSSGTTEQSTTTTESATTRPTEPTETTGTETTEQTQPVTENTEVTGTTTSKADEF